MIKETYETQEKNDVIRIRIIRAVMRICTTRHLENIETFVNAVDLREFEERPMDIVDIAGMLDTADVVRVLDAIERADERQIAARQIKEAFSQVLYG